MKDKIDILVDLSGHSTGSRLGIFARKPAPIQVTAWGFALGTGLPEMDYFFADPVLVPEEERHNFTEKIWDLPCVMTMDTAHIDCLPFDPEIPYWRNGHITFGCFGRYQKISDAYLDAVWQILLLIPDSKIIFRDFTFKRPYSVRRIMRSLNAEGFLPEIEPSRLLFASGADWIEHIKAYQQADIILDPFPHTGGVSSMEQVHMGVPIITRYGRNTAGRLTSSLLTAIGRKKWIAADASEYIAKAVELAKDIPAIEFARKNLRREFVSSPVVSNYVESAENAYRKIWQAHLSLDNSRRAVVNA
jgi:predicted O-linked N-acetylglucosamine transferase (SPINDLY family)